MSNKITNTSNSWHTWGSVVDDAILSDRELDMTAKVVFWTLCTFATPQNRSCFPKVSTIADKMGVSVRTVQYALADLEGRGVIRRQYNFDHSQPRERRQKTTTYYLIGHKAECYGGDGQMEDFYESPTVTIENEPEYDTLGDFTYATCCTTSVQGIAPQEVYQNKDTYIPKGESESPSQDSQEHVEENEVTSHQSQKQHDSDQQKKTQLDKAQFPGKPFVAQAILTPDDAPHSMRPTAELFLIKTGRAGLTNADISAFRELNGLHTPARIQTEIYTQLKKFAAKGRPASSLNMPYIASVLRKQKPTFKPLSPGYDKTPEELAAIEKACRDLNACVITTPDDMTEEEAIAMMERTDALLREMGEL